MDIWSCQNKYKKRRNNSISGGDVIENWGASKRIFRHLCA